MQVHFVERTAGRFRQHGDGGERFTLYTNIFRAVEYGDEVRHRGLIEQNAGRLNRGDLYLEVEIAQAKAEIGAEGIGCEPASAVTLAGLKKLVKQGFVKPDDSIVLVLTGHSLKDPDFTIEFHRGELFENEKILRTLRHPPVVLDAKLDAVIKTLEQAEKS